MAEDFSDAALVLVGHGSVQNADSGAPVFHQAAELRRRGIFAQIHEGFWKQEPKVSDVLPRLTCARVFIVPLFISDGYFSEKAIPRALGFSPQERGAIGRTRKQGAQQLFYCRSVGSHESMTQILLARARQVIEQFPFPRAPKPRDITLFIAGHGTEQDESSRKAIEAQAQQIRLQELYGAAHAVFLEEEPRIEACYELAATKYVVVVPFFISQGLHVQEDLPMRLGEPARIVQERLQKGQATWRNPTEKHGKLVWLAASIGFEPLLAQVIVERVREAAAWDKP